MAELFGPPFCIWILEVWRTQKFLSFFTFQCLLHDSAVLFSGFWNFLQIKDEGPNFFRRTNSAEQSNYLVPLLYFNISSFKDPNSLSCIRFQWILDDSAVFFSCFWKFFNLKRGDVISWGNQFWRTAELFGPSSCISILEVQKTQILCHSLHFNAFSMIQQYFSQVFANSSN